MEYSILIDEKSQKFWEENDINKFQWDEDKKKLYVLEMFSYPSGSNLHAGHWFNFGLVDSYARYKKMNRFNIFQPMGFDAFGLPAENYAIKTGIHPKDSTMKNIETMRRQLKNMGAMFNFENEIVTCTPEYYKWTQWLFLKLYEKNLAYRKNAPVNFCPSCDTVLANEQVIDNKCERCSSEITKKNLTQWFFKITEYGDELVDKLDSLDWPEKTKAMQKNWIGRSFGSIVNFSVDNFPHDFNVFTTRVDTLMGVSYVVLAPEHPLVLKITSEENLNKVKEYIEFSSKQSEIDRVSSTKEKTGVFTGAYAIHPITNKKVPIWISDYVISTYGTGAVMAVPAHDERDFEFAQKFNLEIKEVIKNKEDSSLPRTKKGILINSGEFNSLTSEEGKEKITSYLKSINKGDFNKTFRLRDWLVSRQRYWGAPIPIIYCDKCETVPVEESSLPVELPYNVKFNSNGKSSLETCEEFKNTTCPKCGGNATRETDTLDTFVCSSWYYLRYVDPHNDKEAFNKDKINKMLPVDKYVGGPEHACMHLLYARFITKALRDMGYLNFDEPFTSLTHQGLILGPDGFKMSKSRGNTISPDEYIEKYGSDVFRTYLMFAFTYTEGGAWSDEGIKSIHKFIQRSERLINKSLDIIKDESFNSIKCEEDEKELLFALNNSIKFIKMDVEILQFNTCIAHFMKLTNEFSKYLNNNNINKEFLNEFLFNYLKIFAPFAPHFSEYYFGILQELNGKTKTSVFLEQYPSVDEKYLTRDEIEIAIQINGKIRAKIFVSTNSDEETIKNISLSNEEVIKYTQNKTIVKIIVIKNRLVNIVVK